MSRPPAFIHAGAPKAGSTWLHAALSEHPGIYLPPGKELQFFDKHYKLGEDWYEKQFSGAPDGAVTGDLSPEYLFHPEAAARIAAYDPSTKILITLREPVKRLLSWRQQRISLGEDVDTADEWLTDAATLEAHLYAPALKRIFDHFPRQQIQVSFHAELRQNPQGFLDKICDFISAAHFTPEVIDKEVWGARAARNPALTRILYAGGQALRQAGLAELVGRVSTHPAFTRLIYRKAESDPGSVEARRFAHEFFSREYDTIEMLTGRPLPRSWRAEP